VPYLVNHIHLKSAEPEQVARWFCEAFNMKIERDTVRPDGYRTIRTMTEGGLAINISSARAGEALGPADDAAHYGLEHFGFDTDDIEADIARLVALGAVLKEGPTVSATGGKIGFIGVPGGIRIELIQRPSAS
jgi:catechol 2,3-dioxygenase-like lactoylglutathione lyase family enzyme